jgi:glycerophosphoryl diester phosphodiesterase
VHVWTVNEQAEMSDLLDMGVDGLISDYPGRALEVLRRRSAHR